LIRDGEKKDKKDIDILVETKQEEGVSPSDPKNSAQSNSKNNKSKGGNGLFCLTLKKG